MCCSHLIYDLHFLLPYFYLYLLCSFHLNSIYLNRSLSFYHSNSRHLHPSICLSIYISLTFGGWVNLPWRTAILSKIWRFISFNKKKVHLSLSSFYVALQYLAAPLPAPCYYELSPIFIFLFYITNSPLQCVWMILCAVHGECQSLLWYLVSFL